MTKEHLFWVQSGLREQQRLPLISLVAVRVQGPGVLIGKLKPESGTRAGYADVLIVQLYGALNSEGPILGLMLGFTLCIHHPKILRSPSFSFCIGPCK